MRNQFIILFTLISTLILAQTSNDTIRIIKQGKLTMKNNEQIIFSNLRYENDRVIFTNIQNQQEEHLYADSIISIDEGSEEWVNSSDLAKSSNEFIWKDGTYETLDELKFNQPKGGSYSLIQPKSNRKVYNIVDEKGRKNKKAIAHVQDGILYIRPNGIRKYQKNKKGLTYTGNRKNFLMTDFQSGTFTTNAQFGNNGVLMIGTIAGGLVGGMILYMATLNQKNIVLDINTGEIFLQKPTRG